METPTADDLLQFRDYSVNNSGTPAQINVNSPTHATSGGGGGGNGSGNAGAGSNAQRQRGDPLSDLIYDMSNSPQAMSGGGGGGSGGNSKGASFDDAAGGGGASGARLSFLTIEYYQQFFNVDTYMVLERIANSMIPKRAAANYLRMNIGENPDLYGPFWITVTLVSSWSTQTVP